MRKSRIGALVASSALASATILGGAGIAGAQQTEGPVMFMAEGNDQCEVTFTISNQTNSTAYTMDYRINDEPLEGQDFGTGATGRIVLSSDAAEPHFGSGQGYVSDRFPVVSETTVNLNELEDAPATEDGAYTVSYRIILGPDGNHRGDGEWHETTVTGCETEVDDSDVEDPEGDLIGSIIGSVDVFGSLEGMS